jgi:hypothetical protein
MRLILAFALYSLFGIAVYGQRVAVTKVEIAGEKIIVHYDLEDSSPNREYLITLYSSQNNFATALAKVTGDVGGEISPGTSKKIVWNAREELGAYKGKLALEVRGKVVVAIARFSDASISKSLKRGKTHNIHWKSGTDHPIHIELMKGGMRVSGELNQPNNGSFSLYVPGHASIGKDYTIRITDSKNPENVVNSAPFRVSRKVPLLLKAVAILGVGAGIATFINPPPPEEDEIPLPVIPKN